MQENEIDAVILWVDGSDPKHIEKLNHYKSNGSLEGLRKGATSSIRFEQANEVYFCIKSIRKFAKWINKIYLVTDNQVPSWLNSSEKKELNVEVVSHESIFGQDKDLLPVFNSTSIECYIHNIEGLSEKFIYLNDDFFFVKETSKSAYFDEHLKLRGSYYFKGLQRLTSFFPSQSIIDLNGLNSFRGGKRSPRKLLPFLRAHAPMVLKRDVLEAVFSVKERRINAQHRFRSLKQVNPIDICFNTMLNKNFAKVGRKDWSYMTPAMKLSASDELRKISLYSRIKTLCIQDLINYEAGEREKILSFLNEITE